MTDLILSFQSDLLSIKKDTPGNREVEEVVEFDSKAVECVISAMFKLNAFKCPWLLGRSDFHMEVFL